MKRKIVLVIILLFMVLITGGFFLRSKSLKESQVCFKNISSLIYYNCFDVEIAKTSEEHNRGLMYREKLGENRGMLFVFDKEAKYSFWMKNTLIPLDIIWINENKEVVFIGENAQPCQQNVLCLPVNPNKNAKYVLEINAGVSKKTGLKVGDKLNFKIR